MLAGGSEERDGYNECCCSIADRRFDEDVLDMIPIKS